jgi:hypothetical protein
MPYLNFPDWLYVAYDNRLSKYVYIDGNGDLAYSVTPVGIVKTPEGWQKKSIAWERDIQKWGLVRTFTVPLQFVGDGRTLAQKLAIQKTFEADITLLIRQLKLTATGPSSFDISYIDFYAGQLSLQSLESDEIFCKVPFTEPGIFSKLKSNEGTTYDIPFDEYDLVKMDGINLQYEAQMTTFQQDYTCVLTAPDELWFVTFTNTSAADDHQYLALFDIFAANVGTFINYPIDTNYFAQATGSINPTFTFRFSGRLNQTSSGSANAKVLLKNQAGTTLGTVLDISSTGFGTIAFSNTAAITVPLVAGDKLFLVAELHVSGGASISLSLDETNVAINYYARLATTYVKAMSLYKLLRKLTAKITGTAADFTSTLLQANLNLMVTCGDAVRGIEGAVIKTTFSDAFRAAQVLLVGGMGIEGGVIAAEELAHFLSLPSPTNLGTCKAFKWSYAEDLLFNSLKIGYNNKTIEGLNGKYSFNNAHIYTTIVTKVSKQLEIVCPYTTDPFYIEEIRRNTAGKTTTDDRQDNDVMMLNVDTHSGVQSVWSASKTSAQAFSSGAGDISFDALTGTELTPSAGQTLFTFLGTQSQPVSIFYSINISKSDTTNVQVRIEINGAVVQSATVAADSSGHINTPLVTTLNPGDVVKLSISHISGVILATVNTATMNITFTGVTTYNLKRVTYVNNTLAASGVPDLNTLFNIEDLTPHRLLLKWMKYLNSVLFQFAGEDVTFQSTEKNRSLITDDGTTVIDEDATELLGTTRYFKGIYFSFENRVNNIMATDLQASPNNGFQTTRIVGQDQDVFKGILMKAAMAPNTEEPQSFKLLAAPDTDENKLTK